MGSNTKEAPFIDLTKDPKTLEPGTQEWKLASRKICDAFENDGCIVVNYDKLNGDDREELLAAIRSLFDLPVEAKARNSKNATLPGSIPQVPLYETQAVMDATHVENAKAFTQLMWPNGNENFCKTINTMSSKMLGIIDIIMNMVFDNYGVSRDKTRIGHTESRLQMIKYAAQAKEEDAMGMPGHTDFNYLTILSQNEVGGLMVKSKEGGWMPVDLSQGHFAVFAGEALRAWSNGRLHPSYHQVVVRGLKDRLCCGVFLFPKGDQVIEPAPEFVDEEHPLRYKPFVFSEFHQFRKTAYGDGENILQKYYGI